MIIKNFKLFTESLLNVLNGLSLEEFIDTNKQLSPQELLDLSVNNQYIEGIEYALEHGADINKKDQLYLAVQSNNLDLIKYLVEHGADIHAYGEHALKWTVAAGFTNLVRYLVQKGANIHSNYDEVFKVAKRNGNYDILNILEEQVEKENYTK